VRSAVGGFVVAPLRRQKLQRNQAAELRVAGLVDHTHPAATELGDDRSGPPFFPTSGSATGRSDTFERFSYINVRLPAFLLQRRLEREANRSRKMRYLNGGSRRRFDQLTLEAALAWGRHQNPDKYQSIKRITFLAERPNQRRTTHDRFFPASTAMTAIMAPPRNYVGRP
jgi:hypothetical protein